MQLPGAPRVMLPWLAIAAALIAATGVQCFQSLNFTYVGCFVDSGSNRDLTGLGGITGLGGVPVDPQAGAQYVFDNNAMTHEFCARVCSLGGFPYFGLQARAFCFCGRSYGSLGQASDADCSQPTRTCTGDVAAICGGQDRNSVYALHYGSGCQSFHLDPSRPQLQVDGSYTQATYWTATAPDAESCVMKCHSATDCQAVIFNRQAQLCYLLKFALVPQQLNSIDGDFYARG